MSVDLREPANPGADGDTPWLGNGILLVEDEAVVAMDLADQLEDMGYRVCGIADNGADARAMATALQPSVVLMDVVIKGPTDGIELASGLGDVCPAPVIFLTAFSDLRTVRRATHSAPYGYLTKPFQRGEVRAAIEVAVHRHALEARARESERWTSATLRSVAEGLIAVDMDERVRFMNPKAQQVLGIAGDEASGRKIEDILVIEDLDAATPDEPLVARALRENARFEAAPGQHLLTTEGEALPIEHCAAPIHDERGRQIGAMVAVNVAGRHIAAYEALRQSEERFRAAFNFAPIGIALMSLDLRFLQANPAMCELLQHPAGPLLGLPRDAITHPEDRALEDAQLARLLANEAPFVEYEKRFFTAAGEPVWSLVSAALLRRNGSPVCYIYQAHDMRTRKEAEQRLSALARTDALTGLANRRHWREVADWQIEAARTGGRKLGVLFLDLDHFKQVNDGLGHAAGDQLLKMVAQRLRAVVRDSDLVARFGGDEFVVLISELTSREDAAVVGRKLIEAVAQEFALDAAAARVGLSVGAAVFPDDGAEPRALLQAADNALYTAKAEGRNRVRFASP
jgi:diguanylate cyclase (GGDEF)-like protein/PAS domain S-box-containing protein